MMTSTTGTTGTTPRPETDQLHHGTVRLPGLIAQSMGATGVEINAFSVASVVTLFAGVLAPLAYLLATVAGIAYGRVIGRFAKKLVSAGGTYQFIRKGLGGPAGIFGGSIYFMGLFIFVPFTAVLSATTLSQCLASMFPTVTWFQEGHWFEITLVELLIAAFMAYRGLRISVAFLVGLVIFGFAAIVIFDVAVLATTDWSDVDFAAFFTGGASSIGFGSFMIALGLAMGGFFASETAVFLGEETKDPEKTMPRAVMLSIVSMMALLVVNSFAIIAGLGTSHADRFSSAGAGVVLVLVPLGTWYGQLLLVVVAIASFTSVLALFNSNARLMFDWGREGSLPRVFARVRPSTGSPAFAIVALLIASVVCVVAALLIAGDSTAEGVVLFSWALLAGALWILLGYVLGVSAIAQQWHESRGTRMSGWAWIGYVAPVLVVASMGISIVSQVSPFPAAPLDTAPMLALAWVAVSAVIAIVWRQRFARRSRAAAETIPTSSSLSTVAEG